tara:strand:+ start:3909 stop:4502 length:594 start_codon:yes stop_codon:yes gene_type:complete
MNRKLKLYGKLAEFVGVKEFDVQLTTIKDAVSFLVNNFEGIEQYMNPQFYQVKIGNYAIDENELDYPLGQNDIHFIPVIAGRGDVGKIVLGGLLIAFSFGFGGFFANPMSLAAGAEIGFGAKIAFGIGASLVLSGVSNLLFPLETPTEPEDDPRVTYSFSGLQNTSRAGTALPIVYGEVMTGSIVISAGIDTDQVTV